MLADLQQYLMSQPVVFTAKTMAALESKSSSLPKLIAKSSSLNSIKMGHDGLIGGMPSAEAKVDIVSNLGEAGEAADPTTLGRSI